MRATQGAQTATGTVAIAVTPVADAPNLAVTGSAAGSAQAAIPLTIAASLVDTDGSESLTIRIAGVPSSGILSAGTRGADGVWTLTAGQLAGLSITPNQIGQFSLTVTATATEQAGGNASRQSTILVDGQFLSPLNVSQIGSANGGFPVGMGGTSGPPGGPTGPADQPATGLNGGIGGQFVNDVVSGGNLDGQFGLGMEDQLVRNGAVLPSQGGTGGSTSGGGGASGGNGGGGFGGNAFGDGGGTGGGESYLFEGTDGGGESAGSAGQDTPGGSGQAAFDVGLEGRLSAESGRFDAERAALLAAFGAVARATGSGAAG